MPLELADPQQGRLSAAEHVFANQPLPRLTGHLLGMVSVSTTITLDILNIHPAQKVDTALRLWKSWALQFIEIRDFGRLRPQIRNHM